MGSGVEPVQLGRAAVGGHHAFQVAAATERLGQPDLDLRIVPLELRRPAPVRSCVVESPLPLEHPGQFDVRGDQIGVLLQRAVHRRDRFVRASVGAVCHA